MPLPLVTKTWSVSANNRVPFVSLNNTMAKLLFGVKAFLKAQGYTVAGSSNGTTGAMDGVDRWSTFSDAATRGATTVAAQSWIVLVDGNGVQILLAYVGASDDLARLAFSAGALYVAAGTPTFSPTATDETAYSTANSLINALTTGDRIWNCFVDSTRRLFRVAVLRQDNLTAHMWGVERVNSVITASNVVWTQPVWGFAVTPGAQLFNVAVGSTRVVISSNPVTVTMTFGIEAFGSASLFGTAQPEAQGGQANGYPIFTISIGSSTASARGKYGNLIDWWMGRTTGAQDGDTYGNLQLIGYAGFSAVNTGNVLWPWDGATAPMVL